MFTALILMCSLDELCYTITNENGFFESELECKLAIEDLISSDYFATSYMYFEEGTTYRAVDIKCVKWNGKNI
jgi:hypothetical protein